MSAIFTASIQNFVDKTQGNADLIVRKIALEMFSRVIMKSPVDTGRFRANWQVGIESIPGETLDAMDKSGGEALARVSEAVLSARAGQTITLVNNLAYARKLEYGYSKQAPAGMVRITLAEFGVVVAQAADEVRA